MTDRESIVVQINQLEFMGEYDIKVILPEMFHRNYKKDEIELRDHLWRLRQLKFVFGKVDSLHLRNRGFHNGNRYESDITKKMVLRRIGKFRSPTMPLKAKEFVIGNLYNEIREIIPISPN